VDETNASRTEVKGKTERRSENEIKSGKAKIVNDVNCKGNEKQHTRMNTEKKS
jgi:hypothetical protein